YQYLKPGVHGEYDLWTYGRDGQLGGDGPDSDVGNWN
ncbi:MAG: type II secretion system protein GspG, partial [Xanthomonadales bacterium]|nr:type II secretion system protein GspG [Xanthomonadales bacterium]